MAIAAAFSAIIALEQSKTIYYTGVTIYGTQESIIAPIAAIINEFPNLQKDTGNVCNIPESEYIDIPLIDNQRKIYKSG